MQIEQTRWSPGKGWIPKMALLIRYPMRKIVLKQQIEEEVEGATDILHRDRVLTGFYSNGEISLFTPATQGKLRNQMMAITTLSE